MNAEVHDKKGLYIMFGLIFIIFVVLPFVLFYLYFEANTSDTKTKQGTSSSQYYEEESSEDECLHSDPWGGC
jgi:hypothetical protein